MTEAERAFLNTAKLCGLDDDLADHRPDRVRPKPDDRGGEIEWIEERVYHMLLMIHDDPLLFDIIGPDFKRLADDDWQYEGHYLDAYRARNGDGSNPP